jgi:hypothetical protein
VSRRWYFASLMGLLFILQIYCLKYYLDERAYLFAYLNRVTSASRPPSEQAKDIVLSLKDKPDQDNVSYFLCPLFRPLRPTPPQVIEHGGDCADRSRLVVALLRLHGIHASKWALYNAKGESVHAVVQADTESGQMVVDPLFGLWFPKPQGGYYDIRELKTEPAILAQRINSLKSQGLEPGADRLETYEWKQYVYSDPRTINWNKSPILEFLYLGLHGIWGEKVDNLQRPAFVEEPALMVLYGTIGLELLIALGWVALGQLKRSKALADRRI